MALNINGYNTDFNAFVKCPWGLTPWTQTRSTRRKTSQTQYNNDI